ncbi:hypothetical protein AXG89_26305 (plasmid) [Burkholderia sp. PAMC 26561]|nr:hypothetical protein AXG89_22800 [Burkholderia sp. PAMC 26561]AME27447.1 hypothetical protein AXG89_26305 [Burkholderia sp. PAMC 26561]
MVAPILITGFASAASYILGDAQSQYIHFTNDLDWLDDPQAVYDEWQLNACKACAWRRRMPHSNSYKA